MGLNKVTFHRKGRGDDHSAFIYIYHQMQS